MTHRNYIFRLAFLCLFLMGPIDAIESQSLNFSKSVTNASPIPNEVFNFVIDASCNSTTGDCENVVITDTLPSTLEFLNFSFPLPDGVSSASYDINTREIIVLFDASACSSCSPDGIGDEDDFAQGSSIQLFIQVHFPDGTIDGYQANNIAYISSDNAGNLSDTASAIVTSGLTPGDFPDYKGGDIEQISGGYQYWHVQVGNIGFSTIDNYLVIDTIPTGLIVDHIRTPEFLNVDHTGDLYYMRSDMPGTWILWTSFNLNSRQSLNVGGLGLPGGVIISQLQLDLGSINAEGLYNPYIYASSYTRGWVIYAIEDGSRVLGDTYTNCAYYSGTSLSTTITDIACHSTSIISSIDEVGGYIIVEDIDLNEVSLFAPQDSMVVSLEYFSLSTQGQDIVGGVMAAVLPPNISYVPGSWYFAWGEENADFQTPIVETEVLIDGRELIRFVFDSSYNNSFILEATGSWDGFRISFKTYIDQGIADGNYDVENYFYATGSVHDNCNDLDADNYLNGYSNFTCFESQEIDIIRPPSSAGLQSKIEVIGTLDMDYNRYPTEGLTVPGGISNYRMTLRNPNAIKIDKLVFVSVLPFIGDSEVLDETVPRSSQWQPFLAAPVSTGIPQLNVEYSIVNNPCRDELAGTNPIPFPSGCNTANWSSTPPSDITKVTALKFDYGNQTLNQDDSLVVNFAMRSPVNAPADTSIAWNSFAYIARNKDDNLYLLPAEPIKVGIELRPGNLPIVGDYIWEDTINNGLQDINEAGVDGVLIELYHDANGNGIAEPGAGDTLELFTRSAFGGYYLFSDFDYGYYFVIFSDLPSGFVPTYSNIGSNNALDSDGLISGVMLFDNTIDDRTIDLGLFNGSLPELCTNGVDDDGDGDIDCADGDCPTPSIVNINSQNPDNCPLLTNGSITINATGANIEYSIDNGNTYQSSNVFSNLMAGTYNIIIRNNISLCEAIFPSNPLTLIDIACTPVCDAGCDNSYRFNWFDGSAGQQWAITNGEVSLTRNYTITGGSGDVDVDVTLTNTDGQNIDFSNCGTAGNHFYSATCDDPNATTDCDGDPGTSDGQFSYGCDYLTFGITSNNSAETTSFTFDFEFPTRICELVIGDIDFQSDGGNEGSWQDEIDIVADNNSAPISISVVYGGAVIVTNNNTANVNVAADFQLGIDGNLSPDDAQGQAVITTSEAVTSITFTYSNGPLDDGLSDDHAIRISSFDVCPEDMVCKTATINPHILYYRRK